MDKYNYYEAVKADVMDYINHYIFFENFEDMEELEEHLNDQLWINDSVTGNASGSYTFNTWEAEENICHNLDLLEEAFKSFGSGVDYLIANGAEAADVTIRCYILPDCIADALDDVAEEFYKAHENKEDDEE